MKMVKILLGLATVALLLVLAVNAVKTVRFSHEQVTLVNEVQLLKKTRDKINAEWTQLLLEQQVLADDSVVEYVVRTKLNLHLPEATKVVYLGESTKK